MQLYETEAIQKDEDQTHNCYIGTKGGKCQPCGCFFIKCHDVFCPVNDITPSNQCSVIFVPILVYAWGKQRTKYLDNEFIAHSGSKPLMC